MYFNRKCKITFVCHGATIYSEEGRFSDAANYPPLSEEGVDEIENVVKYLKSRAVKNDVIYSSPAVRTQQSAELVSKLFKQDFEIVEDLTSRQCGQWNGLTYEQILAMYPDGISHILANLESDEGNTGESTVKYIGRIKKVIDDLVEKNTGNRIIIVTHPDVIQAAICGALGISADKMLKIYIRTGSVTQISYFENWASLVYCGHVPL